MLSQTSCTRSREASGEMKTMLRRAVVALMLLWPTVALAADPTWEERPDWASEFTSREAPGTMLVFDESQNRYLVFDRKRAETPYIPASTFKIFNALVGLETGAVKDEFDVARWDGVKRGSPTWDRDTDLAAGMKFSTVWFYQAMARRIGDARMREWIEKANYGNRDIGGTIDRFWLDGKLRISAVQQVEFLRKLADGTLPFAPKVQEAVRRITIVDSAPHYVMHAKSGWRHIKGDAQDLGWFVGWVESSGKRWFFALNMDMPSAAGDGVIAKHAPKREAAVRAILTKLGALPSK
jgi:beta-lactamase class D